MKVREKLKIIWSGVMLTLLGILACAAVVMAAGNTSADVYADPYRTEMTIQKVWDDAGQEDKRPESVDVNYRMTLVLSDNAGKSETLAKEGSVTLNEAGGWQAVVQWDYSMEPEEFRGSYSAANRELTFEVEEVRVDGYVADYEWDKSGKVIITNTYTNPTGDLSVKKTVSGEGADTGKAFDFTLHLTDGSGAALTDDYSYAVFGGDGSQISTGTIGDGGTFSLSHGQTITVTGLPAGTQYSVTEVQTEDYTSEIISGQASGMIQADAEADVLFNNRRVEEQPETVDLSGTKTWNDSDDQAGARPDSIEVNLWKGETLVAKQTVGEESGWTYCFADLPKYDGQGAEIMYTVTETPVAGYVTSYDGYDIINTYTPDPAPEKENPPAPKTGDAADIALPGATAALAGVLAAAVLGMRRRRNHR